MGYPLQVKMIHESSDELLTDQQTELVLADLAAEEKLSFLSAGLGKQTWSRYLVERYLKHYKWYYPNRDNVDTPPLANGWAYFEHFTLPRRFDKKVGGNHIRAPPGERHHTKLYSVLGTPLDSLADWGIGMSMYFTSLIAVGIIFFSAGMINIANMIYYASDEYDINDNRNSIIKLMKLLHLSAICTDREWVLCSEGCDTHPKWWNTIFTDQYYGTAINPDNGEEVVLINRTTCLPAEFEQGIVNYGTMIFLLLALSIFFWYLGKREVRFDEDNTIAPDYSIVVTNPPPDAVDPDEWKDFFVKFADKGVTLVTVALDNEALINKLVQRRMEIKKLKHMFLRSVEHVNFDDEADIISAVDMSRRYRLGEEARRNCFQRILGNISIRMGLSATEDMVWERIKLMTEEIRELQQHEYKAAAIFVSFETQKGQRTALTALNASVLEKVTNKARLISPAALFRGNVLSVEVACEPNAVRWTDLQHSSLDVYLRQVITFCITGGLAWISYEILKEVRTEDYFERGLILYSVVLSTFNTAIPMIVTMMVKREKHYHEGSSLRSLYTKITLFRWVNTVFVPILSTPSLVYLGANKVDLITSLNSVLLSEMFVSPIIRYVDPVSMMNRHYFAPRAKANDQLFSCFKGGEYNLAERFTDFTKVLLLCIFYSAYYPLIYGLGAIILFVMYWTDKYLLLRSWQKKPYVGPEIARFSRTYFNSLAILIGTIASGYFYVRAPFTNLCSCETNNKDCPVPNASYNNVQLIGGGEELSEVFVNTNETFYYCNQFVKYVHFPPVPRVQGSNIWMTEEQTELTRVFGWTCCALLILYLVMVLGRLIFTSVLSIVKGTYEPSGIDQCKDFSSGIGVETFAYIPQLEAPSLGFPLLVCNIDHIDIELIGWKDPNRTDAIEQHRYDSRNMIFDVPHESLHRPRFGALEHGDESKKHSPIFSIVKHYPPSWAKNMKKRKRRRNRMMSYDKREAPI